MRVRTVGWGACLFALGMVALDPEVRSPAGGWTLLGALVRPFAARPSQAGCNLIPPVERSFPSTLGSVSSPLAAPGTAVEIRINPRCDGASPGFDVGSPANNTVLLTFQPPGGGATTDVPITSFTVIDTLTLRLTIPDTSPLLPPLGLAGPARIKVSGPGMQLRADIGPLFQPTSTCDRQPEALFEQLTVLPPPNVFADLASGSTTRILFTLDGGGNVLIPLNYLLILPLGPGAPVARFIKGQSGISAFSVAPGVPVQLPSTDLARSFTVDGRPLPPLLRVTQAGDELYGTTDAIESVIRIARRACDAGTNAGRPCNGAGDCPAGSCTPLYDFTDRLFAQRGPVVIDKSTDGFTVTSGEPVPLVGLRSSTDAVAFARDETIEGDLNGDGDATDRIVQLVDVGSASGTNTQQAVSEVRDNLFSVPAIDTSGSLVAFLESEHQQQSDIDGDGDRLDAILRVVDASTGMPLTGGPPISAAPARQVNNRSVTISGPLVAARKPAAGLSFVGAAVNGAAP